MSGHSDCGLKVGPSKGWRSQHLRTDASVARNEGVDETALFQLYTNSGFVFEFD